MEQLLEAQLLKRPMEADLAGWVADLEPKLADKLARVGLIPKPERKAAATMEPFIEGYIARRTDAKPNTRRIWRQTLRNLTEFFGPDKPLAEITRGDATDWRLSLIARELADASVRKHCGFAKHFFSQAVDRELIPANPFGKLISSPVGNEARQYFVSREKTSRIQDAAPDAQWRLIIAPKPIRRPTVPERALGAYVGRCGLGTQPIAREEPQDRTARRAWIAGSCRYFPNYGHSLMPFGITWSRGRSTSSPATATPGGTYGRNSPGSSSGPGWSRGLASSTTCERAGKRNSKKRSPLMLSASGSATAPRWRENTICNFSTNISDRRSKATRRTTQKTTRE